MSQDAKEIWGKWPENLLTDEYAKKRIKSAKSKKLTPIKIDDHDFFGYFQSSRDRYETFLDSCSCIDFIRNNRPCKHMFRLAMELGLLNEDFQTDIAAVPTVSNEKTSLSETIDKIETLSTEAQTKLLRIVIETTAENPDIVADKDAICIELLNSGLVCESENQGVPVLKYGSKKDILEHLNELNLYYDPKWKKAELETYCTENYLNEMRKYYVERISIYVPSYYSRRKMHYYLHRKLDIDLFFDGKNVIRIPLLNTELPNDDVTEELIKRGYYKFPN